MKNWLKKQIIAITVATTNVTKNLLSQEKNKFIFGENIEQNKNQSKLLDGLKKGILNSEVKDLRWRTYKVLLATQGITIEFNGYDKDGNPIYKTGTPNTKRVLNKVKIDDVDDYDLELVFDNVKIGNSITDSINDYIDESNNTISANDYFATLKAETPLIISRTTIPKFDIERYTKKLNVRTINDTEKLLEFYVSKYPDKYNLNSKLFINEIKKAIKSGARNLNSFEIDEVGFISNNTIGSTDFLLYGYNKISFDKIIEFDGYYVIKFKAEITINGEDILKEFIEPELDIKYANKESKLKRIKKLKE